MEHYNSEHMMDEDSRILPPAPMARPKRAHRKSKTGCLQCKRRKIKCDESQPGCLKCAEFCLPCSFDDGRCAEATVATTPRPLADNPRTTNEPPLPAPRRRGRPRKNWLDKPRICNPIQENNTLGHPHAQSFSPPASEHGCSDDLDQAAGLEPSSAPASPAPGCSHNDMSSVTQTLGGPELANISRGILPESDLTLNMTQAKLLHHFMTSTGPSLASSDDPDDPICRFWVRNAALVGFSAPYVLHLLLAIAAYHFNYLGMHDTNSKTCYVSLARHHFDTGLWLAAEALRTVSPSTCGEVYVSTLLVCSCTFAAGPTGPGDLLICDFGGVGPSRWVSLAKAARLIRELYDSNTLFKGLTEPLGPASEMPDDLRPTYIIDNLPRLDWGEALATLGSFVMPEETKENIAICESFGLLVSIYEATFGDTNGQYKCASSCKMVLIWLYLMEDEFIACLINKDHRALLLLAYYAPLLKTMKRAWLLNGWPEHILQALKDTIDEEYKEYVVWPTRAVEALS